MTTPLISAFFAAYLIILQQILMFAVGFHRLQTQVGVGVADDIELERKVRRHGNLAENGALLLAVLALAELVGVATSIVTGFAITFAVARLSHALAFSSTDGSHNPNGNKIFVGLRALGSTVSGLGGIALGGYLFFYLLTL